MNELTTFHYDAFDLDVRITDRNGDPWFVATDLAKGLGYRDANNATSHLDPDEKGTAIVSTIKGDQELSVISEPGMFRLLARSKKSEAKPLGRGARVARREMRWL